MAKRICQADLDEIFHQLPDTVDATVTLPTGRKLSAVTARDLQIIAAQLGRPPRGLLAVAWRCPCGKPGVVATRPRLHNGAPFPTFYYLTSPQLVYECSKLESHHVMVDMTVRIGTDNELAAKFRKAHEIYLADRESVEIVDEIADISAGGMPSRVKCLHALVAHSLAVGPGVNPIGDEALALLTDFWSDPCQHARFDHTAEWVDLDGSDE